MIENRKHLTEDEDSPCGSSVWSLCVAVPPIPPSASSQPSVLQCAAPAHINSRNERLS